MPAARDTRPVTPRVETIQRRIQAAEAAGYVVRCIRADGAIEVAKPGTDSDDDLSLVDMRKS